MLKELGPVLVGIVAGLASAALAVATFWLMLGSRVGTAEANAKSALQTAAEAAEDVKDLSRKCQEFERELSQITANTERELLEIADRVRREFGQTVDAMQQKIHEFETWSRDEFMRKQSFEAMMNRMEKAQELRDQQLYQRLDRIEKRFDNASPFRRET